MAAADETFPPAITGPPTSLDLLCRTLCPDSDAVDSLRNIILSERNPQICANSQMEKAYEEARNQLLVIAIQELRQCSVQGQQRKLWKVINSLSKRHDRPQSKLPASSLHNRISQFYYHFSHILNQPTSSQHQFNPPPNLIPALAEKFTCSAITQGEIEIAFKNFPKFRAFGPDRISAAAFKSPTALLSIRQVMNRVLLHGEVPPAWLQSEIVAIPKKPNAATLDNFRGISLMSVTAKLFNKVMLLRLAPIIDPLLLPWQSGFRKGRSTIEQITALRLLIDRCKVRKKDVVVVFVDFSKAFDSVDRAALHQIIQLYGVPDRMAATIMSLYSGTNAFVRTPDGPTDSFNTSSGILQGDTLAPFLFVVVMDYVLRKALLPLNDIAFTISPSGGTLPALAYADDIAILANDLRGAERMVTSLAEVASTVGLHINFTKTEVLAFCSSPIPDPPFSNFPNIKLCEDFSYLGSLMADSRVAFQHRRRLAWTATRSLTPIFNSSAPQLLKARLFQAVVEPILLYGCESWPMCNTDQDQVNASHRALLRAALNIHWPAVISNDNLYSQSGLSPASTLIRHKRLVLFGKASRAEHLNWPISRVIQHRPQEPHRRRGRPPTTLWTVLDNDLRLLGLTFTEAWTTAKDPRDWRRRLEELRMP